MCAVVQVVVYISTMDFFFVVPNARVHLSRQSIFLLLSLLVLGAVFSSSSFSSSSVEARRTFIHSLYSLAVVFCQHFWLMCILFSRLLCTISTQHRRRRHIIGMRWCDSMKILWICSRVECEIATHRETHEEKLVRENVVRRVKFERVK